MTSYILRRVLLSIFIIWIVITGSFFLVRLMPGNPMQVLFQQLSQQGNMTPLEIQQHIKAIYGFQPHGPLINQYLTYLLHAVQGNLGKSILDPSKSVTSIIAGALPWTILVVGVSLLLSFLIGIAAGTIMAAFAKRPSGKLVTMVSTILSAIPNYLVALLLIYFLTDIHQVFPSSGSYSPSVNPGFNGPFLGSIAYHAMLPVAATTVTAFGGWALAMKGSVVSVLGNDYIRASESWGLTRRRITQSYIGRNSMLPLVTSLALALGTMFGGSVFIEQMFSYPGLGYYLIQSVNSRDYSLMMGCFLLITIAVVLSNFLVDLLYPAVDPRITRPGDANVGKLARRRAAAAQAAAAVQQGTAA